MLQLVALTVLLLFGNIGNCQTLNISATKVKNPPVVDGKIDDYCWGEIVPINLSVLIEPKPHDTVTQKTWIYICYDDNYLYIAAKMDEDRLDKIQMTCNQRDGDVLKDDCLVVTLDTYCDKRNAYYFVINPLGTKADGRIIDDGRTIDSNWDGKWETKTSRDSSGWMLELSIPFSELRFNKSDSMAWGINIYRAEKPHWENTSLANVSTWNRVSQYGILSNIKIASIAKYFELLPFAMGKYNRAADSLVFKGGVDINCLLTSYLKLNATYLPDFAQIESDPNKFNLSYQQGEELFWPEKRPFFIEGSSILYTPLILFYTRRMNEIKAGVKLYGNLGSTEALFLDVQTKDTKQNYSLLRLKKNLFNNVTSGIIATNQQKDNIYSRAFGTDLSTPLYGPLLLSLQMAYTDNSNISGDTWGCASVLSAETPMSYLNLSMFRIGSNFNVDQGFISENDIGRVICQSTVMRKLPWNAVNIKYIEPGLYVSCKKILLSDLMNNEVNSWINIVTTGKWRFNVSAYRSIEYYDMASFNNRNIGMELESNYGGNSGIYTGYYLGHLYNQNFRQINIGTTIHIFQPFTIRFISNNIKYDDLRWKWLTNTTMSWQVTNNLFIRIFLKTNSKEDLNPSDIFSREYLETMNTNLLIGYELRPGSFIYVVYNQLSNLTLNTSDNIYMVKISYSIKI